MTTRGWQWDLDTDPSSEIARREREREARDVPASIDLEVFVRDALAGAIGDENFATQDAAIAGIERAIAARFRRALTRSERTPVMIAVVIEWNRRALRAARIGQAA
jgi:hypothetical protein